MKQTASQKNQTLDLQHAEPRICLIDVDPACANYLRAKGYSVQERSFGSPYTAIRSNMAEPLAANWSVNGLHEAQVVIIDLKVPETAQRGTPKIPGTYETHVVAHPKSGEIDPRPFAMGLAKKEIDLAVKSGAICVVFASSPYEEEYELIEKSCGDVYNESRMSLSNYGFSRVFQPNGIHVEATQGQAIHIKEDKWATLETLRKYSKLAHYRASLERRDGINASEFIPLAWNSLGQCIAAYAQFGRGAFLILPQFKNKVDVVSDLIEFVLPSTYPELFPDHAKGTWTSQEKYELVEVLLLEKQRNEKKREYLDAMSQIDSEIAKVREREGFLHGLLTATDDALVDAVKQALNRLGFRDVRIPEEESGNAKKPPQEDLQIHDSPPIVLVEVKGIAGFPREDDVNQVHKYVLRRSKEWERTDIRSLFVVNHARNLSPMERNRKGVPFTEQQIEDAINNECTLCTTWTLFRLLRAAASFKWPLEEVRKLLLKDGEVGLAPTFYAEIGNVAKVFPEHKVLSIPLAGELKIHETICLVLEDRHIEWQVESMQINRAAVTRGSAGDQVGIVVDHVDRAYEGLVVYKRTDIP